MGSWSLNFILCKPAQRQLFPAMFSDCCPAAIYLDMDFRYASIQHFLCFPACLGRIIADWCALFTLKLMESLLIVKIAGWVFDRVITCLWRVGIHDYDWLFILCFRIVYKSSALQLLLVLMPQKRNESTISLINVKYKKRLVIFSWVQPMAGVDHLRAYRWQHEPLINLITSVKLKCKVAKDLSSSSSVHWRWCDHSLIEMCQDRSAEGEELLQISIGSLWLRLEGKPHFKRRGMSRTGSLRSCCQVDQAVETEKATKGKGLGPVRGIEQNGNTIVFLLRTLSSCISGCSCFPNPSSCHSLPIYSPRLYP